MRASVLLGDKTRERTELLDALRAERLGRDARDAVRRALVETLLHGSRADLSDCARRHVARAAAAPILRASRRVQPTPFALNRCKGGTDTSHLPGYRRCMDEATRVLARLERIEALDRGRAGSAVLLGELRALVGEAEAWARLEGDARARGAARAAAEKLRGEAEGMR